MRAGQSAFAAHLPDQPLAEDPRGYQVTYTRSPLGLLAVAQRGDDRAEGLIQWVFGSGKRGQTPMLTYEDRFLEHRVSFYAATNTFGITNGHPNGISGSAVKALGLPQTAEEVRSCFGCHSSGSAAEPATFIPGVQCVRCHAGAAEHAAGRGKPANPGKLNAVEQVKLCGTCHRVAPQPGHDDEIANVRFQPLRLMKSRCFLEGKIACTTCHPAHRDAVTNDADFYNRKCQGCHGPKQQHIALEGSADCIRCHMPRSRPHPALEFTDHFIRVVAAE